MADEGNGIVTAEKQQEKRVFGRPFPPGVSGNPLGRPKKEHSLTDLMREILNNDPVRKRALVTTLLDMAAKKDIAAIREVLDRLEGKPLQSIESKDVTELSLSYGHSKSDEPPTKARGSDTDTSQPKV